MTTAEQIREQRERVRLAIMALRVERDKLEKLLKEAA